LLPHEAAREETYNDARLIQLELELSENELSFPVREYAAIQKTTADQSRAIFTCINGSQFFLSSHRLLATL